MYSRGSLRWNKPEETRLKEQADLVKKPTDSLDNFLRSMGTDSFSSLNRSNDKPVQCIYWPDANISGWPLLTPNVQTHKCDKCTQDFFSLVNCRRHMRGHRKTLQTEKDDLTRERSNIAVFWNQLSLHEASQIVSVSGAAVDELSGNKIVQAFGSFMQQNSYPYLTQPYFKAGALLETIQKKAGTSLISADELFKALDDASEKTFLTGSTSVAVVRYIYQNDSKIAAEEEKNAIASLAFLVEDNLVKAWNADKNDKALRCQKALVEEEEAAQKKKEKILEKKRLKKLRQKERKTVAVESVPTTDDDGTLQDLESPGASVSTAELPHAAHSSEGSDLDKVEADKTFRWADGYELSGFDKSKDTIHEEFTVSRSSRRHFGAVANGIKSEQEHNSFSRYHRPKFPKASRPSTVGANGYSVWARKAKGVSVCDASTDSKTSDDGAIGKSEGDCSEKLISDTVPNTTEMMAKNAGTEEGSSHQQSTESIVKTRAENSLGDFSGLENGALLIGSLSVPLDSHTLETSRLLQIPSERFDSLEKELLTSVSLRDLPSQPDGFVVRSECPSSEVTLTGESDEAECLEMQVEKQILLNDGGDQALSWESLLPELGEMLSKRWDSVLADPEAVVATVCPGEFSGETAASEPQDGRETPPEPGGSDGIEIVGNIEAAQAGDVGQASGNNVLAFSGTDDRRLEVKNGSYRKSGARWQKTHKEKSSEQRYLPKKQAPA